MKIAQCEADVLREALCTDAWFASCDPALQDALLAHGRPLHLDHGNALYRQGEHPLDALYCVLEGMVCVGSSDENGSASLLVCLEPFHWFGEMGLINGLPRTQDARAEGAATVFCVALYPFTKWLQNHPTHWQDIARLCAAKLQVAYQVIGEPGGLHRRLARRLWLMAHGFGSRALAPCLHLAVTQERLAQMMGSSRQSIHAALRELEAVGVVSQHYRGVDILDLAALLRHANGAAAKPAVASVSG